MATETKATNGDYRDRAIAALVAGLLGVVTGGYGGASLANRTEENTRAIVQLKTESAAVTAEVREKHAGVLDHLNRIEKSLDRIHARLGQVKATEEER